MKISVWDTYVKREDNKTMHFDILVPSAVTEEPIIFNFGMQYLKNKSIKTHTLTAQECRLCHVETATEDMEKAIEEKGYYIIEMENCN